MTDMGGTFTVTRHRGEYIDIQGSAHLQTAIKPILMLGFETLLKRVVDSDPDAAEDVESFMVRFREISREVDFSRFELNFEVVADSETFGDVDVSVTDSEGNMDDSMLAYALAIVLTDMSHVKAVIGQRLYS